MLAILKNVDLKVTRSLVTVTVLLKLHIINNKKIARNFAQCCLKIDWILDFGKVGVTVLLK